MMDAYKKLANAIILQAVRDYQYALKRLVKHPHDDTALCKKREVERFFHSGLFSTLTDINPEMLIRKLKEDAS